MSKVDKVNEDAEGSLDEILKRHDIYSLLNKLEASIAHVDREDAEFAQRDEADKSSALHAIAVAKTQKISSVDGRDRKKRILPGEYIGYHAYKLKLGHRDKLRGELEEVERENDAMEKELSELLAGWKESVEELEGVLGKMDEIGAEK